MGEVVDFSQDNSDILMICAECGCRSWRLILPDQVECVDCHGAAQGLHWYDSEPVDEEAT